MYRRSWRSLVPYAFLLSGVEWTSWLWNALTTSGVMETGLSIPLSSRYLKKLHPAALHMVSVLLVIPSRLRLSMKPSRMLLLHDGRWSDARIGSAIILDSIMPWRYFSNILIVCERWVDPELLALIWFGQSGSISIHDVTVSAECSRWLSSRNMKYHVKSLR